MFFCKKILFLEKNVYVLLNSIISLSSRFIYICK